VHYGESTSAERHQLLPKIRFIAKNIAKDNQDSSKSNFDKKALPHSFNIDDLVITKMLPNSQLMSCATFLKNIVPCVNGNKSAQTNPLLFDPNFARQFIKECQSWLINKQSMCAKCKLQLGQHLADNQVQNDAPTSSSIHQQCHHFNQNSNSS
jgi:hypothetical protein